MANEFYKSDTAAQLGLRSYTPAEIQELYRAHQRGEYAGKEIEWRRQEVDIYRAQKEGRVTGGQYYFGK